MNISKITIQQLKQPDLILEDLEPNIRTMDITIVESKGLNLKHNADKEINEALKELFICSIKPTNDNDMDANKELPLRKEEVEGILHASENECSDDETNYSSKTMELLMKYFTIWKKNSLTKNNKSKIKEEQINKFIDKLKENQKSQKQKQEINRIELKNVKNSGNNSRRQSSPQCTNASELFENRYKAQRDIILMQKSKLLEQEQMIQELQFGKVCDALKTSYEDSQATIKKLLTKFSTHTKLVTGVRIVEEPEEIQMRINKVPKLVKQMEQRAQERELKRRIIQERKKLIDEERKRLVAEQIERKRIQDEDEKKKNLDAIKDRRRKEVEEEKRKQHEKAKYLEKMKCAEKFYKKKLKKRAVFVFKLLKQQKDDNENISAAYYEAQLLRKCFYEWKLYVEMLQRKKLEKAVTFYENKLKTKSFRGLTTMRIKVQQNIQVATDFHNYQLQCKSFKKFYLVVNAIKIRRYYLMRIAMKHYKTRLLVQSFYQWKSLPAVLQLERAKEEKKRKWREKVLEVLPDYKPPEL